MGRSQLNIAKTRALVSPFLSALIKQLSNRMKDFQEILYTSSRVAPVFKKDKRPPPPSYSHPSIPILHYLSPINNSHLYYFILNIIFPSRNFIYRCFTTIC